MRSTFMGLETSKRGLYTQQSGLYTTGHNISNANTIGYSRQRVNMQATLGYPGAGLNAPMTQGHIGTGVEAGSIQRVRDQFVDRQFRQEATKLGYWSAKTEAMGQMEDVLNEPSEYGLKQAFNDFYKSMQDISTGSENASARKVALERAAHLADSFNYINSQLKEVQGNLKNELRVETDAINSILRQIAEINEQIQKVEPNGYLPNDLYDARDNLIDQLSEYVPIEISYTKSGGNALGIAEGSVVIKLKGTDSTLVEGNKVAQLQAQGKKVDADGNIIGGASALTDDLTEFQAFTGFGVSDLVNVKDAKNLQPNQFGAKAIDVAQLKSAGGKMISLAHSYGYQDGTNTVPKGEYPSTLQDISKLAKAFVSAFNQIHKEGYQLNSNTKGEDFFAIDAEGKVTVKITDPSQIAASTAPGEEGNGKLAIILSNLQTTSLSNGKEIDLGNGTKVTLTFTKDLDDLEGATTQSFYQGLIGKIGVNAREAENSTVSSATNQLSISNRRASVSSVSLDEEMTNMIMFQQAYNASARMVTVVDETLDKIINGMGRVGI
ncbi:flagellar hook-associated protein FlgK [Viridibacillus arvi]|uniref:Flagellar hook-associated protein 1 n=1 Tax=Viridibacillus arvi TaxID=263475 RepID=A0A0M0LFC4_9BACL|nr:flagellar hook-associated protein FlgK [Viridibacillus arvi]KOO49612.1 flagellar biosynthesis protein FlgK [Viridibacillus arvi]